MNGLSRKPIIVVLVDILYGLRILLLPKGNNANPQLIKSAMIVAGHKSQRRAYSNACSVNKKKIDDSDFNKVSPVSVRQHIAAGQYLLA